MERYRVGFGRTGSTLVKVHPMFEFECVINCLVYDALWHHTIVNLPATQLQRQRYTDAHWCWCWSNIWNGTGTGNGLYMVHHDSITIVNSPAIEMHYNGNDIRFCADIDWIYATVSCWLWTNSWYVGISVCLNVSLIGIRCTMTPAHLHTRLLFNYNDNDIRLCFDIDWIYATVSCWLWTSREYVGISVCLNVSLIGIRCTMAQAYLHTRLLFNCNDNDIRLCVDVDWIYATVSCWLWTNREYVGITVWLNLNVSLLGIRCTMTPAHLHTRLLCNYNDITYGSALMLIEYMERCHDCWIWTNRKYVGIVVCLILNVSVIASYTLHHGASAFAHLTAIQLQWQWYTALCWCWLYIWNGVMTVGFERTECTLVLVYVWFWIWICHYLMRYTMTPSRLHTHLLLE